MSKDRGKSALSEYFSHCLAFFLCDPEMGWRLAVRAAKHTSFLSISER